VVPGRVLSKEETNAWWALSTGQGTPQLERAQSVFRCISLRPSSIGKVGA